jgi:hypothetical protein
MHQPPDPDILRGGTFGYRPSRDCGATVRLSRLGEHVCAPERYAVHQARRLHWRRAGFDEALRRWLDTPAGRFAQFYARRMLAGEHRPVRPDEA